MPPAANTPSLGTQSQAQQQSGQPSLLGQQPNGDQRPSTKPAFFNSLLERGKKRPVSELGHNAGIGELPSLQLGLDDIRRKARELGTGGTKEQSGTNSKA